MRPVARRSLIAAAVVGAVLVALRIWLPYWVTDELNRRLATMGEYHGSVRSVDLHLWRGAYRIHGLNIVKRDGRVPVPLLDAPQIDLSISWRELFHGALVGEVVFRHPQLNFVDGGHQGSDQTGRGVGWREKLEELFLLRINQIVVHDGVVAFRNLNSKPAVDLRAVSLEASVRNLTNVRDLQGRRDADVDASARILGEAPMELKARFDPWGALDDFTMRMRITDIELPRLNDFTRAYARLDFEQGRGEFVMELEAADGTLRGYAKPLLHDINVLDWEQDVEQDRDNPVELLWEGLSGAVSGIFKNHPRDQFATRIPIEGRIDDPQLPTAKAIINVLRNAFVKAYEARFE